MTQCYFSLKHCFTVALEKQSLAKIIKMLLEQRCTCTRKEEYSRRRRTSAALCKKVESTFSCFQRFVPFRTGNTDRYVPINIFFTELSHQSFMHSHDFKSTIIYVCLISLQKDLYNLSFIDFETNQLFTCLQYLSITSNSDRPGVVLIDDGFPCRMPKTAPVNPSSLRRIMNAIFVILLCQKQKK